MSNWYVAVTQGPFGGPITPGSSLLEVFQRTLSAVQNASADVHTDALIASLNRLIEREGEVSEVLVEAATLYEAWNAVAALRPNDPDVIKAYKRVCERENPKRVREINEVARTLKRDGVVVVPSILDSQEFAFYCGAIHSVTWPEFQVHEPPYVMGGFGAFGHASSFHHPLVRSLRALVKRKLMRDGVFSEFGLPNLEGMYDRVCARKKGFGTISTESWHQDLCRVAKLPDDVLFGGWTNLSYETQFFKCKKGTQHELPANTPKGFEAFVDPVRTAQLNESHDTIEVPPGHCILIQQGLIHAVFPTMPSHWSYRLFHGFRLTKDTEPIMDVAKHIKDLSVPPIPSGQTAPMWAKNHWGFHTIKIHAFAQKLKPEFRTSRETTINGEPTIVDLPGTFSDRQALGLRGRLANVEMYEYSKDDVRVLFPEPLIL